MARAACRAAWVITIALPCGISAGDESPLTPTLFADRAARGGLRMLEGSHLLLATDRPVRSSDGLEELPRVFDAAFDAWCAHYGIDPDDHEEWRAMGCLVVDRERFRAAGLLPDHIPDFTNGFCERGRFWFMDQSNPAYRRHLLLHEGVHAFTLTIRSLATPTWYTEGIAEYLATHRLEGDRFVSAPMPKHAADVEQLGRVEQLQELVAAGRAPSLADVFGVEAAEHRSLGPYAASWAAVAMLSGHPRYAAGFSALQRGPLDASFTERLERSAGWEADVARRDFAAFLDGIDYGYDFARCRIDWSSGRPLDSNLRSRSNFVVDAGRGWQNTGLALEAGGRYALAATGRCGLGRVDGRAIDASRPIRSEADGVSLDWYRGRPVGRLLVAQWIEEAGRRPTFRVVAEGSGRDFVAAGSGVAYARINEAPGRLDDNDGAFRAEIRLLPTSPP